MCVLLQADPHYDNVMCIPYLDSCIHEALRLYPLFPLYVAMGSPQSRRILRESDPRLHGLVVNLSHKERETRGSIPDVPGSSHTCDLHMHSGSSDACDLHIHSDIPVTYTCTPVPVIPVTYTCPRFIPVIYTCTQGPVIPVTYTCQRVILVTYTCTRFQSYR